MGEGEREKEEGREGGEGERNKEKIQKLTYLSVLSYFYRVVCISKIRISNLVFYIYLGVSLYLPFTLHKKRQCKVF